MNITTIRRPIVLLIKLFLPSFVRKALRRIRRGLKTDLLCYVLPHRLGIGILERSSVAELVCFNPCATQLIVNAENAVKLSRQRRFLLRGEWDKELVERVDPNYLQTTIREMWVDGRHYRDTEQYARMCKAVDAYTRGECDEPSRLGAYWCLSHSDIDRYFQMLIDCYEDMRTNGYKTQAELYKQNSALVRSLSDELRIAINRDGEAVFVGLKANHRFSMLRHLGITRAPAGLIGVSDLWVKKEIALTGFGKKSLVRHILTAAEETLSSSGN